MNLYSDDFLKELFTDVLNTSATEKVMVVCSFVSEDGTRRFATYILDVFRVNIDSFIENSRLSLDDPNFINKSNVLDFVSNGAENYFPQLHLIDTITFKRLIEYMRQFKRSKKVNKVNEGGLFSYYIADPSKLPSKFLAHLERHQILIDLKF